MTAELYNEYKKELFIYDDNNKKYHSAKGPFNPNIQYYMADTIKNEGSFISQKYEEIPTDKNPNDETLSFHGVVYPSVSQLNDYAAEARQDYI
jgi:hypothetical protein